MKNWKKILSVTLAGSMMLSMAACGSNSTTTETDATTETETAMETDEETDVVIEETEEAEVVEETGGPSEEIMSAAIIDNMVQVNDDVAVNGELSMSTLFDYTCEIYPLGEDDPVTEDYLVYGGESTSCTVYFVNESTGHKTKIANASYINTSESSISIKDCAMKVNNAYYDADEITDVNIYFAGGIGTGSTISDVTNALGEPYLEDEGDSLVYTYYAIDNEQVIRLKVTFDRNTSTVTEINTYEDDFDVVVQADVASFPYCFPAYDEEGEVEFYISLDTSYLSGTIVTDPEAVKDEIRPYFVQYYNEEITEEEYLNAILPILTEYGFYERLADLIASNVLILGVNELYDFGGSWSEIVESALKGDLSDEIYEIIYGPLESYDPR